MGVEPTKSRLFRNRRFAFCVPPRIYRMLSFYDYYDQLENRPDSEPDDDEQQEVSPLSGAPKHDIANAADDFANPGNVLGGTEYQSCDLKPITWEDITRGSMDDVTAEMWRKKALGLNPTKLGDSMSDEEFDDYTGMHSQ